MESAAAPTILQQAAQWAQILFYAVTTASLVAAALLGILKYRVFRSGRPFITITLQASSRPCSASHTQIGVTAELHNGSRVLAKANTLEWECHRLAAYDEAEIEAKIAEHFQVDGVSTRSETGYSEFPWNLQQRITKRDVEIEIEPNDTSHDSVTFIVPRHCTAVQIKLFITDTHRNQSGWTAVIYHDTNTKEDEP